MEIARPTSEGQDCTSDELIHMHSEGVQGELYIWAGYLEAFTRRKV